MGTTPLAMLGKLPEGVKLQDGLTAVAHQLIQRLKADATFAQAKKLVTSACLITGLRVRRDVAKQVFQGVLHVFDLRESSTFLGLQGDRVNQSQRLILLMGNKRFGTAGEPVISRLENVIDLEHLERIAVRMVEASDWDDLLATP